MRLKKREDINALQIKAEEFFWKQKITEIFLIVFFAAIIGAICYLIANPLILNSLLEKIFIAVMILMCILIALMVIYIIWMALSIWIKINWKMAYHKAAHYYGFEHTH